MLQCELGPGVKALFQHVRRAPIKIMLLGGICSEATRPIAECSQLTNLVQVRGLNLALISYASLEGIHMGIPCLKLEILAKSILCICDLKAHHPNVRWNDDVGNKVLWWSRRCFVFVVVAVWSDRRLNESRGREFVFTVISGLV